MAIPELAESVHEDTVTAPYIPTYADPYAENADPPRGLRWLVPRTPAGRTRVRRIIIRTLVAANLILATNYVGWRLFNSINWSFWWIAIALLVAESYSYVDSWLFGLAMWRWNRRGAPPPPLDHATVDVFITCYNEPVELVRRTARAARDIAYPHLTHILDDGGNPAMRAMAEEEGVGYIIRSEEWANRARHAKAGNLINALYRTDGEFILILDADQIPAPEILHRTLGFFRDPRVSFVQTTQFFYNVPPGDPYGSQAPLFYGPIQQGKDGWNAAFFCGSNAVLRREALMQLGITSYVRELNARVRRTLHGARRMLRAAERSLPHGADPRLRSGLRILQLAVRDARAAIRAGRSIQEVTWEFQRVAEAVSDLFVIDDLASIRAEIAALPDLDGVDPADIDRRLAEIADDDAALRALTGRAVSPLAAIGVVRDLLMVVDVDRSDEVHPVMPMATISVTEDMATAMRMQALGWKSVYLNETLCVGLAPEDMRSAVQQRLRWAQGTIQVMLRENPLLQRGLTLGQRLMYFATMWSYLSGFFALVYLLAPACYLFFGWLPVRALSSTFFLHLIPFLVVNQLLFIVIGWKRPTWRGQQYSLALFPVWITAVTSAVSNVWFGKKLAFAVTPKTRQAGGIAWRLVRWQLGVMALLVVAMIYGVTREALGITHHHLAVVVNVFWCCYDLLMLSVVFNALFYKPADEEPEHATTPSLSLKVADVRGRP